MTQTFQSLVILYDLPTDGMQAENDKCMIIESAQKSAWQRMFGFTSMRIGQAFKDAYKRGVDVRFLLDHLQSLGAREVKLLHWLMIDIPPDRFCVTTSELHEYMHDKVLIIDADADVPDGHFEDLPSAMAAHYPLVITGSTNDSDTAYRQANQMLVMPGKLQASFERRSFVDQWNWALMHESAYKGGATIQCLSI